MVKRSRYPSMNAPEEKTETPGGCAAGPGKSRARGIRHACHGSRPRYARGSVSTPNMVSVLSRAARNRRRKAMLSS